MAGQSVVIVGTINDGETTKQVTITGVGAITTPVDPGYGVPAPPNVVAPPIYYPPVFPAHPIVRPPGGVLSPPIYYPPEVWPPQPPEVWPKPPEIPEVPPVMPPGSLLPPGWSWYYTEWFGWILVWRPSEGGKPQPPGGGPMPTPHK